MAFAVQMTVETAPDFITFQQLDDLPALIPFIAGRIVEEHHLILIAGRLQGSFQPDQFPAEDLFIVGTAPVLFKEPAPGTADGPAVVFIMIVFRIH